MSDLIDRIAREHEITVDPTVGTESGRELYHCACGVRTDPDAWRRSALRIHLQAVVPLRMAELADIDPDTLLAEMERCWPRDSEGRRDPWVRNADAMIYGSGGQGRESLRNLVTGLAVAALVSDGGVTFDGMHWCVDHSRCLAAS